MSYQLDTTHSHHPHHLECPRCKRHTVVLRGETLYICLNCHWRRDVSGGDFPFIPIILVLGTILVILL